MNIIGLPDDVGIIGTDGDNTIIGVADNTEIEQTIDAGDGADLVIGDHSPVFFDNDPANNTFATALAIDGLNFWSTLENELVADDAIPYTTILGEGDGEFDVFAVQVGANETITLDIDFGLANHGLPGMDSFIELFDSSETRIAFNDDAPLSDGGLGSEFTQDSFLTFTNSGPADVFYIRVGESSTSTTSQPVSAGATYILNVSVTGHAAANTGAFGNDTISGGGGGDYLMGVGGDDIIEGGAGNDIMYGGSGRDTLSFQNAIASVAINLSNTSASTSAGVDQYFEFENLLGSAFDDTLTGDAGDNVIEGGAGADMIDGGDGNDTASYAGSSAGVDVELFSFSSQSGGDADGDLLSNVENVIGSQFDDLLTGSNVDNVINGGEGNDELRGRVGADVLEGAGGDDILIFGDAAIVAAGSVFDGGAGTDTLKLEAGSSGTLDLRDSLLTSLEIFSAPTFNSFSDTTVQFLAGQISSNFEEFDFQSAQGDQTISIAMGDETELDLSGLTISGANGADGFMITGDASSENIVGSSISDTITGGGADDTIEGGAGFDTMDGGAGLDTLSYAGSGSGVSVNLSGGSTGGDAAGDTFSNFERLLGSAFNDTLSGTIGDDELVGGDGADVLQGDFGNDTLRGEASNDTLRGGPGVDQLFGGSGDDVFEVESGYLADEPGSTFDGGIGSDELVLNAFGGVLNPDFRLETLVSIEELRFNSSDLTGAVFLAEQFGFELVTFQSVPAFTTITIEMGLATDFSLAGVSMVNAGVGDGFVINGDANNESIVGSALSDAINGLDGNDNLNGGAGGDALFGGAGNDFLTIDDGDIQVGEEEFDGGSGTDTLLLTAENGQAIDLRGSIINDIERVEFFSFGGSNIDRTLQLDASHFASGLTTALEPMPTFDANESAGATNTVEVSMGAANALDLSGVTLQQWDADDLFRIFGDSDDEVITGTVQNDEMFGNGGDDTLSGGLGDDLLDGGSNGADELSGDDGNDRLQGRSGDDVLSGGAGIDQLYGANGDDELNVTEGDALAGEIYDGGDGQDTLRISSSGSGSFDFLGSQINDIEALTFESAALADIDAFFEASSFAFETVDATAVTGALVDLTIRMLGETEFIGNQTMFAGISRITIIGDDDGETIIGTDEADEIQSGLGIDNILAAAGDDIVQPGGLVDGANYNGGSGIDTFDLSLAAALPGLNDYVIDLGSGFFSAQGVQALATLSNFENVVGSAFDDVITGNDLSRQLSGGTGDDFIFAGSSASVDGGAGVDLLSFQSYAFGVSVNLSLGSPSPAQTVAAGVSGATPVSFGISGIENLKGSDFDDALTGSSEENEINGGAGDDIIAGGNRYDRMFGASGDDLFIHSGDGVFGDAFGGGGIDTIDLSGASFTPVSVSLQDGVIEEDPSVDEAETYQIVSIENFFGTDIYGDEIEGSDIANRLEGRGGDDQISGLAGDDTIEGGDGNDVIAGDDGDDQLNGGSGNDNGTGGAGDDLLIGAVGDDLLNGGTGNDTVNGGSGADTLIGGAGMDTLNGGSENDLLIGGGDDDQLNGQDGNDEIIGGGGADTLNGADGNDTLDGSIGNDILNGGIGNDMLTGGDGDDDITGLTGDDDVFGGEGNDRINTARGDDTIDGGDGDDTVLAGAGADFVAGGDGNDVLSAQGGDDSVYGQEGNDTLNGAGGNDALFGAFGDDTLNGGSGNDLLDGGAGNDVLRGQGGVDTYSFDGDQGGDDTVFGFAAGETVELFDFGYADAAASAGDFTQSGNDVLFANGNVSITFVNADIDEVRAAVTVNAPGGAVVEAEGPADWIDGLYQDDDWLSA